MQSSTKKRKIQLSPENEGEDDWGDFISDADMDMIETQAVASASQSVHPRTIHNDKILEEQLVQEGQIHMLRQLLDKKSKELEDERRERDHKIKQQLENCHEIEQKLQSERRSLQSALKFKDHELTIAQEKIKVLEQKSSVSLNVACTSAATVKISFPAEVPLNKPANQLLGLSPAVNSSTLTDSKARNRCESEVISNSIYTSYKCVLPNVCFRNVRSNSTLLEPCKTNDENHSSITNVMTKRICSNIAQSYEGPSLNLDVRISCYCSNKTGLGCPTKEVEAMEIINVEIRKYLDALEEAKNQTESTSSNDVSISGSTIFSNTALHLANLCAILDACESTRFLLVNILNHHTCSSDLETQRSRYGCGELLIPLARCTLPVMYNNQMINESVVNWAFTALIIVCNHCRKCCCNFFQSVVGNMNLHKLLDSHCSVETTYLVLKFLICSVGIRSSFMHHEVGCVISSLGDRVNSFLLPKKSINVQFIILCVQLLTAIISYHGVTAVYNSQCNCLTKVLKPMFTWIYRNELTGTPALLKILQLIQVLLRYLDNKQWFELCSRLGDSYVLMMNKLYHINFGDSDFVKDLVKELWAMKIV